MIRVRAFTDVGLVRKRNEDCVLVAGWISQAREGSLVTMDFTPKLPFVCAVADGMGGHVGGDLASRVALTVLAERSPDWRTRGGRRVDPRRGQRDRSGRSASRTTCKVSVPRSPGCASTTDGIVVFNVGDSPVFSITDGDLAQISIDDSVFDSNGRPTNIITQSLGQSAPVRPHVTVLPRRAGTYLMCSDGVSGVMTPEQLDAAVRQPVLDDCVAEIIGTTRENGAHDNFSFLVVEIPDYPNAV